MGVLVRLAFVCIALLISWLWISTLHSSLSSLPPVKSLAVLEVDLSEPSTSNTRIVIGHRALLQNPSAESAERAHVEVRRDAAGAVTLANIAERRRLFLRYSEGSFLDTQKPLNFGDAFVLDGVRFEVRQADGGFELPGVGAVPTAYFPTATGGLQQGLTTTQVRLGGTVSQAELVPQQGNLRLKLRTAELLLSPVMGEAPAAVWPMPGLRENAGSLAYRPDSPWGPVHLRMRAADVALYCTGGTTACRPVLGQPWPLQLARPAPVQDPGATPIRLRQVVIGRTTYTVTQTQDALQFIPVDRHHWYPFENHEADAALDDRLTPTTSVGFYRGLGEGAVSAGQIQPPGIGTITRQWITHNVGLSTLLAIALFLAFRVWDRIVMRLETQEALATPIVLMCIWLLVGAALPRSLPVLGSMPFATAITVLAMIGAGFAVLANATSSYRNTAGFVRNILQAVTAPKSRRRALECLAFGGLFAVMSGVVPHVGGADMDQSVTHTTAFVAHAAIAGLFALCAVTMSIRRVGWILCTLWIALGLILALGAVSAASMTFGHSYGAFLSLYTRHIAALAIVLGLTCRLLLVHAKTILQLIDTIAVHARGTPFLVGFVTLGLATLTFVADETGIAGLQPSEFHKSWVVICFGIILARALDQTRDRPLQATGQGVMTFMTLLGLASLLGASALNFDMSPIIILGGAVLFVAATILCVRGLMWRKRIRLLSALGPGLPASVVGVAAGAGIVAALTGWTMTSVVVGIAVTILAYQIARSVPPLTPGLSLSAIRAGGRVMSGRQAPASLKGLSAMVAPGIIIASAACGALTLVMMAGTERERREFQSSLPDVPIERLIGYQDASLFKAPQNDRLAVDFPDFSFQVRRSREVIAATGCGFGQELEQQMKSIPLVYDVWRSSLAPHLHSMGRSPGSGYCTQTAVRFPSEGNPPRVLLSVPAIQDDFAATFLIARFGRDGAVVTALAQAVLLTLMVMLAVKSYLLALHHPRLRNAGVMIASTLLGFTAILGLQFVLSWANIFGALPVVGQPMSFVSLGGSHHLFFVLPAVLVTVIAGAVLSDPAVVRSLNRNPAPRPGFARRSSSNVPHL